MFLKNEPAMVVTSNEKRYLVVADLHIGVTRELYEKGIKMPKQSRSLAERLNMLGRKTRTKNLVIAGDVKHKVPGISYQEMKEIPEFFSLLNFDEIIVTKGNHDGNIEKLVPYGFNKKIKIKKKFTCGDYLLTHGHMNVKTKKTVIIGHNHQYIRMQDDMKAVYREPVWVRGLTKNGNGIIIMPAFNEVCGAGLINDEEFLGPLARSVDKKESHVYLLDGMDLGSLESLEVK